MIFRVQSSMFVLLQLFVVTAMASTLVDDCLLDAVKNGAETETLAEVRARCNEEGGGVYRKQSALQYRIEKERLVKEFPFVLTSHKPNYLMPVSYYSRPTSDGLPEGYAADLDNIEVKFQFSVKAPLFTGVIDGRHALYFAYTNTSWWQAYNKKLSSPFRETNHEPEMFYSYLTNWELAGVASRYISAGFSHQSNGRTSLVSRSWNRLYLKLGFEFSGMYMELKPWYRLPEKRKADPFDPEGDDNPEIERYLGNFELLSVKKWGDEQTLSVLLRNNLRSNGNKGAVSLDWSFPLGPKFRGVVHYFNGYGESLVDYNKAIERVGFGVLLSDWL